jgi:hypothetical protein
MTISRMLVLAALSRRRLAAILRRLGPDPRRGRPWRRSFRDRVLITCAALRTNLTVRELAAVFQISKSAAHRVMTSLTPRLGALLDERRVDRRWSWIVDGTLIPTRDHSHAARSKNYRYSCNAQVLVRRHDLRVVAIAVGGPGNRNDRIHYGGSVMQARCRAHVACLQMAAIAESPSSSHPRSMALGSCAMPRGVGTASAVPVWNTPSRASRPGAFFVITDGGEGSCKRPYARSPYFTTFR